MYSHKRRIQPLPAATDRPALLQLLLPTPFCRVVANPFRTNRQHTVFKLLVSEETALSAGFPELQASPGQADWILA